MSAHDLSQATWRRIEAILDRVLDAPDEHRSELVSALCSGAPDLRADVNALLAAMTTDMPLLDRPIHHSAPDLLLDLDRGVGDGAGEQLEGRLVGPYRIEGVLGQGGMGVVLRGRRADGQFDKEVAVKLVPGAGASPAFRDRFLDERQILAHLEHPNIGRLLDGGLTDEGSPYLVMELVDGTPIDRFCREHELPLEARLGLFRTVCAAVDHAHHNLVVHRDLKPSNILVTDEREVKLLDFGIAKLLGRDESEGRTRHGQLLLTPGFAAPEQFRGEPATTATDVYSLGVLLHRLLTDRAPFELDGVPLAEAARIVAEDTAPKPSAVAGAGGEPVKWRRQLRGDLDTIVARAMDPDPQQRFQTAGELSEDVGRFLEQRPIVARPATWRYRAGKLIRRHRLAFSVGLLLAVSVVAGVAGIALQGREAARQRDLARVQAHAAQEVARFLGDLFGAADPYGSDAGQVTARQLLERGEARIRVALDDEPAVRAELFAVMARAYVGIGEVDRAIRLAEEALEVQRGSSSATGLGRAESLSVLGAAELSKGEYEAARRHLEAARRGFLGATPPVRDSRLAATLRSLGGLERNLGNLEAAEEHYRAAVELWRELGEPSMAASNLANLALVLSAQGERNKALAIELEALEIIEEARGEEHPTVATLRNNIALSLHRAGRLDEAAEIHRRVLEVAERTLGPEHGSLADSLTNYGNLLMDLGRFAEAEGPIRRAVRIRQAGSGERSIYRIAAEINQATLDRELGNLESSERDCRHALARLAELVGEDHRSVARARSLLGATLHRQGRLDAASRQLELALEVQLSGDVTPSHLGATLTVLGMIRNDQGRHREAEALLRQALDAALSWLPEDSWQVATIRSELGAALLDSGRSEDGRAQIEAGWERLWATLGPDTFQTRRAMRWRDGDPQPGLVRQ
jgi:serine/threonine-protein kinase